MTQIICLANSWKRKERCIAGIELKTRNLIRPIYDRLPDGCIPKNIRLINGREPQILDVIDIPLAKYNTWSDYALENRKIMAGSWQKRQMFKGEQLVKYSKLNLPILHTKAKYVTIAFLMSLPFLQRRTMQLIYTSKLEIDSEQVGDGRTKWKGTLTNNFGYRLEDASITDPEFVKRLELGYRPHGACLVTVSLSLPWKPPHWTSNEPDDPCWKLIAGVIELL